MIFGIFESFCVFVVLVQFVFGVLRWTLKYFVRLIRCRSVDLKSFGEWALITGATDGIGKEYVKQLAKRGLKIILVSRTLSKLQTVAKEIQDTFEVETAVIDVDFTSGLEIFEKIKEQVKGKRIGVLVNNVGMGYLAPDDFLSIPNRENMIQDIIKCNVISMPMMCSIVLPQMVQRNGGVIINMSSLSAIVPTPELALYSASKAFANKFSQDLAAEYKTQGIIVQSLIPGPVAMTNLSKIRKSSLMIPTAEDFVESALRTVGFSEETTGYWPHSVLQLVSKMSYYFFPSTFIAIQAKLLKHFRDRETKLRGYVSAKN